jgi:hypothetical protein
MSTLFRQPPFDGKWGVLLVNGFWTGIAGEVIESVSGMAFAAVYYWCHISDVIEFTTLYIYGETIWYFPCSQPNPRWTSLSRMFKLSLWLGFTVSYIIVSIFIWAIVKISNSVVMIKNDS